MIRLACLVTLVCATSVVAQSPPDDTAVRRAVATSREHLRGGWAADAVAVLEAEMLNAGDDPQFLDALKAAYAAQAREMELKQADPGAIEAVRRRLKALEGKGAAAGSAPRGEAAAVVRPPAPPIPDPPAALGPPAAPPRDAVGPAPAGPADVTRASEAFAAKRYAQAAALFAEADRRKERFTDAQRDEWAYCRLHAVAVRLNRGTPTADEAAALEREVQAARAAGSDRLRPFAEQLASDLRRRVPMLGPTPAAAPAGGEVAQTPSFRVLHRGQGALAVEVGRVAEAARRAMYERWAGPPAADWAPQCEIHLHATAAEYAKATGKPGEHPGHSTVRVRGGRAESRRIDLRADAPELLDGVLPHEVTQVLLADLFADQPLPRWAAVGMAALAESPEGVARYLRAVPGLLREKRLFAVGPFLDRGEFPDRDSVTAFYAESVSLVCYLVELKGPKAFTAFLREAPRRGYARALATHYGFRDPAELQDRWVKHCLAAE